MGHYVENTGEETLRFLEMFRSDRFADVSLNQWMALTPPELVRAHQNLDRATIDALLKKSRSSSADQSRLRRRPLPGLPREEPIVATGDQDSTRSRLGRGARKLPPS
jgi:hypothetical protein